MTRYYVDVTTGWLAQDIRGSLTRPVAGFRFVECTGASGPGAERWVVEDDEAPADLEGLLVEPSFALFTQEGRAVITDRRVREAR